MLEHWLIELVGHVSGLSDAQLRQIERSLPATKALIDLLNRARPIIEQAQSLYAEAEPLIEQAKKEWQTVGPAAQVLIDVISHHVNRGSSPAEAAETVRAALHGSIMGVAEDHLTDRGMSCLTVFGGTGFVGRRVVRHSRESGTRVRIVSRHRGRTEDDGIEQITADAHDERAVAAAVAGADGVVNAISLYVEHGSNTFHSVHVETAGKIARAARQAGIRRFVQISGIGANAASPSPYIRSRGEGETAVQTAFPDAVIVRPAMTLFLLQFSGCCDLCQPIRYSATAGRGSSLNAWEVGVVQQIGAFADRLVLETNPAVQACRRMRLPANYLYVHNKAL